MRSRVRGWLSVVRLDDFLGHGTPFRKLALDELREFGRRHLFGLDELDCQALLHFGVILGLLHLSVDRLHDIVRNTLWRGQREPSDRYHVRIAELLKDRQVGELGQALGGGHREWDDLASADRRTRYGKGYRSHLHMTADQIGHRRAAS